MIAKYMADELNGKFQLQIPYIPNGTYDTALYDALIEDEKIAKKWVGSGYNGYKKLTFYGKPPQDDNYFEGKELGEVIFPNFRSAYEFIKNNNLKNFQLRAGCYAKEIKQYKKEIKKINEVENE